MLVAMWAGWPRTTGKASDDVGRIRPWEMPSLAGQVIEAVANEVTVADPRIATVTLAAGTRVAVDAWGEDATRLRLVQGRIEADVRHREPAQSFEIRTDLAIIRVVGTRFVVSCVPGVETVVTGIEGTVQVDTTTGTAVGRVTPGLTLRVEAPGTGRWAGGASWGQAAVGPGTPGESGSNPATSAQTIAVAAAPRLSAQQNLAPRAGGSVRGADPAPSPGSAPRAEDVLAQAMELLSRGADREALAALTAALPEAGAFRPRLLALLGDAHRVAGRPTDARTAYEEALAEGDDAAGEGVRIDLAALLQSDLHRPEAAAAAWRTYAEAHPRGRYLSRALWELSRIAEDAGRLDEALATWQRLMAEAPASEEAPRAFVKVGRTLIDRGDLPAAEAWFTNRDRDPAPAFAEAAAVGLMRTRLAQGRGDDVRRLAADHDRRFPTGERADEVRALLEAAGPR